LGLLLVGLLLMPAAATSKEELSPYTEMAAQYEEIRLVLLADSIEGVVEHANAIEEQATDLMEDFDASSSSVPGGDIESLKKALEEIRTAASDLSTTADLDPAREQFFALTKPMARYRKLNGDQTTIVAYCPMAQKAWIQPEGEIGNPYMGQQMPMCGEVVGE
jgi:hypothetical protein